MERDYSKYTVRDLLEVRERISPENAPENYERFMEEFENRKEDIQAYFEHIKSGSEKQVIAIGWVQVVSGIVLILAIAYYTLPDLEFYSTYSLVLQVLGTLLGGFSILAGTKLIKRQSKGIIYSVINQGIQLPAFSIGMFSFNYNALGGLYFTVYFPFYPGFSFLFAPGAAVEFGQYVEPGHISIDLISVIILLLLSKYVSLHEIIGVR